MCLRSISTKARPGFSRAMRFLIVLAGVVLVAASGALCLLLGPVPYARLHAIGHSLYLDDAFARLPSALTPARFTALRGLLFGVLGFNSLGVVLLLRQPAYRQELRRLGQEVRSSSRQLVRTMQQLSSTDKTIAASLLALVLAARALVLVRYGFRYDEIQSYLFFVREGAATTACFYPLPNNHIFYNLCCTLLAPVLGQQPMLLMRLPSYLVAAGGTALSYGLLTRCTNFRLATLVTGLFCLSPPALYYASMGRGYYLQFVLMQLGFFAAVHLGAGGRYQRLGWLVFVGSSILGLYTIPTYAFPLASLVVGLALVQWRNGSQSLAPLLLATVIIGTTATLLYAPVGAVSGWPRLLANQYVSPLPWATFRHLALANIYEKIQEQFGLVRPVLLLGAALLALTPVLIFRGQLRPLERSLAGITWAMLVVPMLVVVAQRTYPPTRAVVYLTYFSYLLAALGVWFVATRWQGRPWRSRWQWALIGAFVLGAAGLRFDNVLARIHSSQHEEVQLTAAWHWLQARHPQSVLLGSYQLFFYYYAVQDRQRVVLADQPISGRHYEYLILPPDPSLGPAWTPALPAQPAFRNDLVSIYPSPTGGR